LAIVICIVAGYINTVNKEKGLNKIRFWAGVLVGTVMVYMLDIPEVSPIIDNSRFFRVNPYVYLVTAGVITGFIAGKGIKGGVMAGFLAGLSALILMIFRDSVPRYSFTNLTSDPLIPFLASIFGLIIMLALPMLSAGQSGD
jgi:hypothetical protein